jgi:hypothetical protein
VTEEDEEEPTPFELRATALTWKATEPTQESHCVKHSYSEQKLQIREELTGERVADLVEADCHTEPERFLKKIIQSARKHTPRGDIDDWEVTVEAEPSDWLDMVKNCGIRPLGRPSSALRVLAEDEKYVGAVGGLFYGIETGEFTRDELAGEVNLDPFVASVDVSQDEAVQFQDVEQDQDD